MTNGRGLALLCLAVAFATAGAQQIVFDNTAFSLDNNFPLLPEWRVDSAEAGDEVWLGGSAREVTQIVLIFNYRGTTIGSWDGQLRFRTIDPVTQKPSDVIYDSGIVEGLGIDPGLNYYVFSVPHVVVPDRFLWSIQAYNKNEMDGEMGPAYYNPATVGWSDDFFWQSDMNTDWNAYSWGGDPYANFGAQITAVPEPVSFLGLAIGLVALRRRRKK